MLSLASAVYLAPDFPSKEIKPFSLKYILLFLLTGSSAMAQKSAPAPKIDSICFHLYTDSLKKGVYNYINVDARLHNGQWLPLTAKELVFSASEGRFEGNSLIIDTSFKGEKVSVKAVLKSNPALWKETSIYIKTTEDNIPVKSMNEVMGEPAGRNRHKKRADP